MAKTAEIGARVSAELLAAIDLVAQSERRWRAEIIRFACEKYTSRYAPVTEADIDAVTDEAEEHLDAFLEGAGKSSSAPARVT